MQEDSEEDDEDDGNILGKMQDVDEKVTTHLSPDDAAFTGELADGVDRLKVSLATQLLPSPTSSPKHPR